MITARQARDKIEVALEIKMKEELDKIEVLVNENVALGNFEVRVEIKFSKTKSKLQSLGYCINYRQGSIFLLKW